MFEPTELFDLTQTGHAALFDGCKYGWEALAKIAPYLATMPRAVLHNRCEGAAYIGEHVSIGEGTVVEDGVMIQGPAIIGRNCQIRHNAYIRQNVIIGDDCVVGNATEVKNSILFNKAQAPHFNYVGDSILGYKHIWGRA
jgi:UDP-N-acetylglucosamine diphosphorylase / glucose-1-phosphate thymidylyltransferase / UDP-N-acetylgalactosamine diphosphorylase / glucosamine-1-phosphate N-acetyltransferase / galactosamine-1-phosphate N-acetyltransferase